MEDTPKEIHVGTDAPVETGAGRRLRGAYIGALSLIALLTMAGFLRLHAGFSLQDQDASVVRLAIEQRELTNNLTEAALIILHRSSANAPGVVFRESDFEYVLSEWEQGQRLMLGAGLTNNASREGRDTILRLLNSSLQPQKNIGESARSLIPEHVASVDGEPGGTGRAVNRILNESAIYIPVLNQIVEHYQKSSQAKVSDLRREMSIFTMLIMIVLILEALLVFEPARKRLVAQSQKLHSSKLAAEDAVRAKSAFLANMSHEIRTPMNAIMGFTDALLEEERTDAQREEDIRIIRRNGRHLITIINSILDMSKLDSGQVKVEAISMSLTEVVDDVARLMRMDAERKGLAFETHFEFPIPQVIVSDPTRIRQILINLISNAIKFTDKGCVSLRVLCESDESSTIVQLSVEDSGMGMDAEQIDSMFKPFTQADSSITRRFGGTGLGLSITKRFVELLGGEISVESEINRGTTIRVMLPVEEVELAPEIYSATEEDEHRDLIDDGVIEKSFRVRILIVEDGADNARLVSHYLEKAGAHATIASNGLEALDMIASAQVPFHLVLMDMQMPVMDGYTATRQLRKDGYWQPIIALTAHSLESDREACLMAGCDDYLTKPVNRRKLIRTCAEHIRGLRQMQDAAADSAA